MESEEDLAERLVERLHIEDAEECLRQLEERLITVEVLGIAEAQDLADECGFTERQCDAVLLDDVAWRAIWKGARRRAGSTRQCRRARAGAEDDENHLHLPLL